MDEVIIENWEAICDMVEHLKVDIENMTGEKSKIRKRVNCFVRKFEKRAADLRHDYHSCNYESGFEEGKELGMGDGRESAFEEMPDDSDLLEAISDVCEHCTAHNGTGPSMKCYIEGCKFYEVVKEKAEYEVDRY